MLPSAASQIRPLALLALIVAAGLAGPARAQSAEPALSPPRTVGVPAPGEQIDAAIARLDEIVGEVMQRSRIPGLSVAVVRGGRTVQAKGFGLRKIGDPAPVDADTVFQLASLSKSVGATVVARQVSEGRIEWTTPLVRHLPWFALSDPWVTQHVTVGDLYAHRAGLPDHVGDDLEDLGFDRRAILEKLRLAPLAPFRAHYAYTNYGLTAAAEAVAAAAGEDWASLSQSALYAPLGMASTSSRHDDFRRQANRAFAHTPGAKGYEPNERRDPDDQSAAGGVSSSARDMARWMALVLAQGLHEGKPFIAKEALLPAISPQSVSSPPASPDARAGTYGYGFGVAVQPSGRVSLAHSGAFTLGAATTYMMIPSLDLGIVVLTNATPVGAAEAVAATFMDLAQFGRSTRDWYGAYNGLMAPLMGPTGALVGKPRPANVKPPRDLSAYVGRYDNAYYGAGRIERRGEGLALLLGPQDQAQTLEPWEGDDFIFRPNNEDAPKGSISRVSFTEFADGRARAMTVEALEDSGFGTFKR